MLMRAATVVQVLQDVLYMFYCVFYFTCDRSFKHKEEAARQTGGQTDRVQSIPS